MAIGADMLIPLNKPVTGPSRVFRIATFDGARILPRFTPVKTFGDLLDYGRSTIAACGCKMSVTVIPTSHYLNLKNPPPEDTLIRDLADWLICKKCGSKKEITVTESGFSPGNSEPRKGFMDGPYYTPPSVHEPVPENERPQGVPPKAPPLRFRHRR